jgi:enamidase
VADNALDGLAAGDIPGITYVIIDGVVKVTKSRNTPPAQKEAKVI